MGRWYRDNQIAAAGQARIDNDMPEIDGLDSVGLYDRVQNARNFVCANAVMFVKHGDSSLGDVWKRTLAESVYALKVVEDRWSAMKADDSIDPAQYVGDHCGYLAAQCVARDRINVEPTLEQKEAWIACNTTTSTQESF